MSKEGLGIDKYILSDLALLVVGSEDVEFQELVRAYKAMSLDDQARLVRDAWYAKFHRRPSTGAPMAVDEDQGWPEKVFDDNIIIRTEKGLFSYPYTSSDDGIEFSDPIKVEVEYRPVATSEKKSVTMEPDAEPKGDSLAIKAIREENGGVVVGGPLLLFGDEKHKDLGGDYFTPETELWLDVYKSVPALFHHGLDEEVGLAVIGHRVGHEVKDAGVWVEDWIDKSSKYWAMIEPLLEAERLFYSPGTAPHLIKKADDGRLISFPPVEDTMTPVPMQHRLVPIEQVKAAYKSAGLEFPQLAQLSKAGAGASGEDVEIERLRALNDNGLKLLAFEEV